MRSEPQPVAASLERRSTESWGIARAHPRGHPPAGGYGAEGEGEVSMINADDHIEETVRSAIVLFAENNEKRAAALKWLDRRIIVFNAAKDLGLLTQIRLPHRRI